MSMFKRTNDKAIEKKRGEQSREKGRDRFFLPRSTLLGGEEVEKEGRLIRTMCKEEAHRRTNTQDTSSVRFRPLLTSLLDLIYLSFTSRDNC